MRIVFGILALLPALVAIGAPNAAQMEFFEAKIRPILVESCYECHSAEHKKSKGGLLLDSKDGLLKGGDTGPSIVPGDPDKSLLIKAVRYTDKELQMPPSKKKLKDEQIAALEEWVKMGAPDPRTATAAATPSSEGISESAKKHWAFQPVKKPEVPKVKNERWVKTPVDAFILEKLEAKGMKPSARADKRTLLRRASFALTGLPPTPEEMKAFEEDQSTDAWEKVIDRLLASPAYGERWARHWLDISRYADTKGYVFQEERRYPFAYTYRDYVIRAFNEDLPYDRFILEQLAADHLDLGEDKRPLAAMGFLTLGRRFLNNEPDIIDDRIDVTMRGLQGLTTTCARCHDHKYDPIPTKDYYSIYGVFSSSTEPGEKPLLGAASLPSEYPAYKAEYDKREGERAKFVADKEEEALDTLRKKAGEYLLVAHDAKKLDDSKAESLAKERKLEHRVVRRWIDSLENWKKTDSHPVFAPWFAFADLKEEEFAAKSAELASKFAKDKKLNPAITKIFETAPQSMKELSEKYGAAFVEVNSKEKLADAKQEELRQILFADNAPANLPRGEIPRLWDVPTAEKARALKRRVDELEATHPGAPPRAMALLDRDNPRDARVFIRGNARNPGAEVPRQYLEIIAGSERTPFKKGSGRLEMAQAIASKDNPLTARVFVNRLWLQHFGAGLVATPSDFGLRSDPPTHPELLDYLAWRFMAEGWSIKKLQRLILTSAVYQQTSDIREDYSKIDPSNALLSRMNRKRLEFEPMRDTLLAVAGTIDPKIGGHPQELTTQPFVKRRTIYGYIDRQNLPGMFRTFDLASPDTTSPQRFNTTVPQQALFMINGPFVIEQARKMLDRPDVQFAATPEKKIERMYQIAMQRAPEADELKLAKKFVESQSEVATQFDPRPVWSYGYGPISDSGKLESFTAFPTFHENRWAGGAKLPDEKLDWVSITETGGHPGEKNAAVRRWTSPRDGEITIKGRLAHDSDAGDGVRGRVLKNASEQLGSWNVKKGREATELKAVRVKRGDTIDFAVDKLGDLNSDSFTWVPQIEMASAESDALATRDWNARDEFAGPRDYPKPLNPWEKLAQVILMSNELVFVD